MHHTSSYTPLPSSSSVFEPLLRHLSRAGRAFSAVAIAVSMGCAGAPTESVQHQPAIDATEAAAQAAPIVLVDDLPSTELPPSEPCGVVGKGYLPRPDNPAVQVVRHEMLVDVDQSAPRIQVEDQMTVRAARSANDIMLSVRAPFTVEQAAIAGPDGSLLPVACSVGTLHDEPYVRLKFPERLEANTETLLVVRVAAEVATIPRRPPVSDPIPIAQEGQLTPGPIYLAGDHWYPRAFIGQPVTAAMHLSLPEGYSAAAFGSVGKTPSGRWVSSLEAESSAPIGWVASESSGERVAARPDRTPLRVLTGPDHPDPDTLLLDWQDKVDFLEAQLGRWPGHELVLAEVQPAEGEAATKTLGLVIISANLLRDAGQGNSYAFDLLARQWLELARPIDPRLVEGMVQVLAARYTSDTDLAASHKQIADLRATYAEATNKRAYTPIASIGLFDEMVVAVVFAKVGVALSMLADTVGPEAFAAGLQAWLADESVEARGIDGLQRAMEHSSGAALSPFFDKLFRGTGLVSLAASCEEGKLVVRQTAKNPIFPLALDVVPEGAEPVQVRFEASSVATTEHACTQTPSLSVPRALAQFE